MRYCFWLGIFSFQCVFGIEFNHKSNQKVPQSNWNGNWDQEKEQRLDAVLRWELGQELMEQGWYSRAVYELEKVRKVIPYESKVEALLGTAYLMDGQLELGQKNLEAALALDPNSGEIGALLAHIWVQQGALEKGSALMEKILKNNASWRQLRWTLIETYFRNSESEKVAPHLKSLKPFLPSEAGAGNFFSAQYWAGQGEYGIACDFAAAAVAYDPGKPDYRREYGLALVKLNRSAEAIPQLMRAMGAGLRDPRLYSCLGEAFFRERKWEEAEKIWIRAVRLYPENLQLKIRLFDYFLQSARPDRAKAMLSDLESDPNRIELRAHYVRKMGRNFQNN